MAEPDGTPAGYGYSYADMCGGYIGRARGAGRAVASAAHRQGPVRRSVAVRGGRQRGRSRAARHLGQRPRAVAARLQFAGRSSRAARRLQMRARCDGDDDRWVAISVAHGAEWRRFVTAIGSPEWASDAKFRTLYMRMQNQRRARRQRLAMDRRAQRRRRDGDHCNARESPPASSRTASTCARAIRN